LQILAAAKKGLVSAQLALLREQAVGRRVEIYWHADKKFYPATITAFDDQHYSHRIEHDDGDIEPAAKLWKMRVNLLADNPGVWSIYNNNNPVFCWYNNESGISRISPSRS